MTVFVESFFDSENVKKKKRYFGTESRISRKLQRSVCQNHDWQLLSIWSALNSALVILKYVRPVNSSLPSLRGLLIHAEKTPTWNSAGGVLLLLQVCCEAAAGLWCNRPRMSHQWLVVFKQNERRHGAVSRDKGACLCFGNISSQHDATVLTPS